MMRKPSDLTAEGLRGLLAYDPLTGLFTWRETRGGWATSRVAGRINADGYRRIGIDGRQHYASHLAWLYMTGAWSETRIDHRDTDRSNNAWCNLRQCTQSQNIANARTPRTNTSGFKGVSLEKHTGKWVAFIKKDGHNKRLGSFATPQEAHAAYAAKAIEIFGEFARVA